MDEAPGQVGSDLIGLIYDCAIDPSLWATALERIAGELQAVNGCLLMLEVPLMRPRFQATWNIDPRLMEIYQAHYANDNPLNTAFAAFEQDEPYSVLQALDERTFMQSRVAREFGPMMSALDSLGVTIQKSSTRLTTLSFPRKASAGWAGPRELALLRTLSPHVRRAAIITDRLDLHSFNAGTYEAALDALAVPVVAVDSQSRIHFANGVARSHASVNGFITVANDTLRAINPACAGPLAEAISRATLPNGDACGGEVILRRGDEESLAVVVPLGSDRQQGGIDRYVAGVFLSPVVVSDVTRNLWISAFQLTAAEARVLQSLVAGASVAEIAANFGVSEPTIRTQVAALMGKFGVSRQAELVARALSAIPPIR